MGTAADVINRVRDEINDSVTPYRWADVELLRYLTDGERAVVELKPEAYIVTAKHTVDANSFRQKLLPATAYKLIRVEANSPAAPSSFAAGDTIRVLERDVLDSLIRAWPRSNARPGAAPSRYIHWAADRDDPLAFYLYPHPVADSDVLVTYAGVPTVKTATSDNLTLGDTYISVLVMYVAYRALKKDARGTLPAVAGRYLEDFYSSLGIKRQIQATVGDNANRPPEKDA